MGIYFREGEMGKTRTIHIHNEAVAGEAVATPTPAKEGRIAISQDADGNMVWSADGEEKVFENPEKIEAKDSAKQSAARQRLEETKKRRGNRIVEHDILGEKWYILKLDLPHAAEAAHAASDLCDGKPFDLKTPEVMTAVMIAIMRAAVVSGPDDTTPYFDDDELAREYVEEPGELGLCSALFAAITNENETIIPLLQGAMGRPTTPADS
jgi:hypothetical protein